VPYPHLCTQHWVTCDSTCTYYGADKPQIITRMYAHAPLHRPQDTGRSRPPPPRPAELCFLSDSSRARQTAARAGGWGRAAAEAGSPPPAGGPAEKGRGSSPAGPSPPPDGPRPGRAAAEAEAAASDAAPRGTRPGPTDAPRRGRRGRGRPAPPHLDLPTPLSPMMRIFRVVSTSSSIPAAAHGPALADAPCAAYGGTICACAPHSPPAPRVRLRCASGGGTGRKTPPPLREAHAQSEGRRGAARLFTAGGEGSARAVSARLRTAALRTAEGCRGAGRARAARSVGSGAVVRWRQEARSVEEN